MNRLRDELACVLPEGPGYHAPNAPAPPDDEEEVAVVLPLKVKAERPPRAMSERQTKRKRTKASAVSVAQSHLDAIVGLLREKPLTALTIALTYGKIKESTMLTALHILEDRSIIERAGIARKQGGPILWGLKP